LTDTRPDPLVPADVDLRDFAFMPLDVARLRDSDLTSEETPESCWAALLLWCAAWHQVPAGSVPDSDQWLAKTAGYVSRGRIDKGWAEIRTGALRGFVTCSDGRLYHPVVCEKVRDAWRSKREQRWKTECARIKKHNQRHNVSLELPDLDLWITQGCPQGQPLPVPRDKPDVSPGTSPPRPDVVPRETHSKGQGEGQGQGEIKEKPAQPNATTSRGAARDPEPEDQVDPSEPLPGSGNAYGLAALAMRQQGCAATPGDPRLRTLVDQGATVEEFQAAGAEAAAKGKGPAWALVALVNRRAEAAKTRLAAQPAAQPANPDVAATAARLASEAARPIAKPPAELLARRQARHAGEPT
jgi:hypothetical protein